MAARFELLQISYAARPSGKVWAQNGRQAGDPAKLAQALGTIPASSPRRAALSPAADAIAIAEQKVQNLQEQINAYRDLSTSLARDSVLSATTYQRTGRRGLTGARGARYGFCDAGATER